jgi:ParB family chromosome partitioning protein
MAKTAIDAHRSNIFNVDPESLTIVTDPAHPLYDERVKLPIDENLVRNIMVHGVRQIINVRKNGDEIEVVDGRQRVRHAIEANKRLRKEGAEPVRVRVFLEKGTDADLAGVTVLLNEHRRDDDVMGKALKAQRLLNLAKTDDEVANIFGVTKQTLRGWQTLLEASPAVQKAVAAGDVSPSAAAVIAKLPRADQATKLAELKAGAPIKGKRAGKVSARQAKGKTGPQRPSVRDIQVVMDWAATKQLNSITEAFRWILGDSTTYETFGYSLDDMKKRIAVVTGVSEAKA